MYLFIDGKSQTFTAGTAVSTNDLGLSSGNIFIGTHHSGWSGKINGYLDEYRVSKGIARWTANFAPGAPYLYHA
jgi:hypothetical protein